MSIEFFSLDGKPEEAMELSARIRPLLKEQDPAIISVALADLTAMLIAGLHPQLRVEALAMHIGLIRQLLPICAKMTDNYWNEEDCTDDERA